MKAMLLIDGSYGEGGGQVLRTSLSLAAITGRPLRLVNIRAARRKPGLMPQHLTGVRAAARVCGAQMEGDSLGSQELTFVPGAAPQAGSYTLDVAQVAKGGSAGSVGLVAQTVLLPLALAPGTSEVTLRGGTHVPWSPVYDYLKRVYLPTLRWMGVEAKVQLVKWGWYPVGGGEVKVTVQGLPPQARLEGLTLRQRGELRRVRGLSASSNLPKHVRERQEGTALHVLRSNRVNPRFDLLDAPSKGTGSVVFLWAEFDNVVAGFTALGEKGKPAERVAEEASRALLDYLHGQGALDRHLADQAVLPLALAAGPSSFTTECVTQHLLTNAWVVNQFFPGRVQIEGVEGTAGALCAVAGGGL
jgi:RNA 3'-terminal phosphate cyclase (ATP)